MSENLNNSSKRKNQKSIKKIAEESKKIPKAALRENKIKLKANTVRTSKAHKQGRIKIAILGIVGVMLAVLLVMLFSNQRQTIETMDPEIAKSMTYDRVKDGDEAVARYKLC